MGNNISVFRLEKGMTQEQLAKKVGISRNYITQIEKGSRKGSVRVLNEIALVLDVNLSDIFLPKVVTLSNKKERGN